MTAATSSGTSNILVIDDDPGLLRLAERGLRRAGFATETAGSGAEALAKLRLSEPDLVLVDLKLPDIPGQELIEQALRQIPFIIITGQGDERVAVEMMKRGALDYFVKDAEFLELLPARIRLALDRIEEKKRLHRTEEALRQEHAFTSAILDTSGVLVVVLDEAGQVARINRAFEELSGRSFAETKGWNYVERFVPSEEQAAVRRIFERLRSGVDLIEQENHILTPDGPRLVTWSHTTLANARNEIEFIVKTGIDISERKRLEREILEVSSREQRRIGQDLHDGLGQHLTGIELMSQALEQVLSKKSKPLAEQAGKIARHVREAIVQTKALARGLTPVEVEANGLMSALHELCSQIQEMSGVLCQFKASVPVLVKNNAAATHLYRIAQEAVNNALKHGRPSRIEARLELLSPDKWQLVIADNGRGFSEMQDTEPPLQNVSSGGMGLRIMKYRAGEIGGELRLERREGETCVICAFPQDL